MNHSNLAAGLLLSGLTAGALVSCAPLEPNGSAGVEATAAEVRVVTLTISGMT